MSKLIFILWSDTFVIIIFLSNQSSFSFVIVKRGTFDIDGLNVLFSNEWWLIKNTSLFKFGKHERYFQRNFLQHIL